MTEFRDNTGLFWRSLPDGAPIAGAYRVTSSVSSEEAIAVYHGWDVESDYPVQFVLLSPSADPSLHEAAQATAKHLAEHKPEGVTGISAILDDPGLGCRCVISRSIEGPSLADQIAVRILPVGHILTLMRRLTRVLAGMHKRGLVHGYLSPNAVRLPGGALERAFVTEVGLGSLLSARRDFPTDYRFLAPEQLDAFDGRLGVRADIYALALTIAAAARGQALDMGSDYAEAFRLRQGVPNLTGVPETLTPLLEWMLQPNPMDRPASMSQVLDGISRIVAENAADIVPLRLVKSDPTDDDTVSKPARTPMQRAKRTPPAKANPLVVALPILGFLGLLSGVGGLLALNPALNPFSAEHASPGALTSINPTPPEGIPGSNPEDTDGPELAAQQLAFTSSVPLAAEISPDPAPGLSTLVPVLGPTDGDAEEPEQSETDGVAPVEEIALLAPSQGDPNPPVVQDPVTLMRAWLENYPLGPCVYRHIDALSETSVSLLAYGQDPAPFEALITAFEDTFGVEPDIVFQPITSAQCAVLDYAAQQNRTAGFMPRIDLLNDTPAQGARVFGTIQELEGQNLWVALIDPVGNLIDLDPFLRRVDDAEARFNLALSARPGALATPHLILALTSPSDLSFAQVAQGAVPAAEALDILTRRIRLEEIEVMAGLRYFRFQ